MAVTINTHSHLEGPTGWIWQLKSLGLVCAAGLALCAVLQSLVSSPEPTTESCWRAGVIATCRGVAETGRVCNVEEPHAPGALPVAHPAAILRPAVPAPESTPQTIGFGEPPGRILSTPETLFGSTAPEAPFEGTGSPDFCVKVVSQDSGFGAGCNQSQNDLSTSCDSECILTFATQAGASLMNSVPTASGRQRALEVPCLYSCRYSSTRSQGISNRSKIITCK